MNEGFTMSLEVSSKVKNYDYLGIMLSILCGLHCIITPLLIIYLPIVGEAIESTLFHTGLIGFMFFAFYQSIYKHFKIHHSKHILGLGLTGLSLFVLSYINELTHHSGEHHHGHELSSVHGDETNMIYIAITGAVLLVVAHILNIRKCSCLRGKGLCTNRK